MDLSTAYMGLSLRSPLVPSASPLTKDLDVIHRLAEAGAGAIVLGSLFEEQIEHEAGELDHYLHYGADRFAESLSYFPEMGEFRLGAEDYLDLVAAARAVVDVPIIASLNGISTKGWVSYARKIADAGAHGLELNVYYLPTNPDLSAEEVEAVYTDILAAVKKAVDGRIPVAMKLSPYFTNLTAVAGRFVEAGAEALVLFNRFYQPDIDPHKLEVVARASLSRPEDNLLPLRWIAILHGRVEASLAATSGIHSGADAAKMILAGADVTMLCSALLAKGPAHLATVRDELVAIMEARGYESVEEMKGVMSQRSCPEPAAYERGHYVQALTRYGMTSTYE